MGTDRDDNDNPEQDSGVGSHRAPDPDEHGPGEPVPGQPVASRRGRWPKLPLAAAIAVIFLAAAAASSIVLVSGDDTSTPGSSTASPATSDTSGAANANGTGSYQVVDTGQTNCYNASTKINCPDPGQNFFGQDAQYRGNTPRYRDNDDGTVTDEVTGLMWQSDPGDKISYDQAISGASDLTLAGHDDWRMPTIKELYSLILFSGIDPSSATASGDAQATPFIDTDYFDFSYGDTSAGDRQIDSQWVSNTVYKSTVFDNQECFFGVNFADGRIKCYPTNAGKGYYVIYVRDNPDYGANDFNDQNNGTVADRATGLTWQKGDSGEALSWPAALSYCDGLDVGGVTDWRLPNAKDLQSILDYTRSPDSTDSAAIDPVFDITGITNEGGASDYGFYWTSTTHVSYPDNGSQAAYVSFGRGLGYQSQFGGWIDVHGAGTQRSDPKTGQPSAFPSGRGPQGDAIRIQNYVRCVSGGATLIS